jgi:endonuclease/exonuclease/phosphatase family metal-dependent hydrolase
MNDELGFQPFEMEAGGDSIANLVGDPKDGLILATRKLIDDGQISYGGYWKSNFRSFIDQVIVTPGVKDQILEVKVIQDGLAKVASDHYPVLLKIKPDPVSAPVAPK